MSHLTRGAWIEIGIRLNHDQKVQSRTSHEVRGLKSIDLLRLMGNRLSHLTRGAWIEIC